MPATEGEAIAARLLGGSGVTALVEQRVYPSKPQQEPDGDYVVYFRQAGGDPPVTLSGPGSASWREVRVEAWARTQARAEAILKAVRARLSGWSDWSAGVELCLSRGDADEQTFDANWQVSGQTFGVRFQPT